MGLRLIYGRAGTGKSQKCYKEISEKIKQNNKILIITPEQFSFTAEKKLMEAIETESVFNAEVVTFSRMAYRVIQEIGGRTETNLSKCGKAMLIYSILNNCKKDLKFLGKTDENIEYIKQNYVEEYITPLIVSNNLKHLQKTLPYLQSIGVLETIKTSASILSLTLDEIKERQAFIESIGEPIVKENKFNSIFGLSRKNYQKKVKEYEEKKKLIGKIKEAIQEGQELDEQINHKKQEQK